MKIGNKYICKPRDEEENEFSIRAIILKVFNEENKVEFSRYINYGKINMENQILSFEEFNKFYESVYKFE